jgi:exodeoxyribonuclease V gamma subunit
LDGGRWTWDEGLTRLALGRFMKDDADIEELGAMGRPVGRAESAPMLALLGPLASDLQALAKGRFTLLAWQERLGLFLRTYLGPDPEEASEPEAEAFEKVRKALQKVGQIQVDGLRSVELDFQAIQPVVKAALEALLSDNALPPGRGVQVSCYTPLRAIPFKVLFLMGLGEGLFPATDRPDPLDLVTSSPRRAGDVSRPEQERQLFLEAVLCAREQLVCTYPSRTATTGDELQPSPLLLDLQETLGPDLWQQVRRPEQPLHRHDLSLFPELNPEAPSMAGSVPFPCHLPAARHEAEARWLGLHLRKEIGNRDLPRHVIAMGGTSELRSSLDQLVGGCGPIGDSEPRLPSQWRITLKELRRWLECPVQGGVALRLGVQHLDEVDPSELEDFPMDSGPLDQWWLLRRTFWTHVAKHSEFESAYGQVRAEAESRAKVPIGPLSQGERQRHLATLDRWDAMVGPTKELTHHRFGTGLPYETLGLPVEDHPALTLTLDHPQGTTEVHLRGLTEPLRGDEFLLLSTGDCGKEGPKDKARLDSLRAWIGHLVLCAVGESRQRFARLHSAPKKGIDSVWRLPLPPIAPTEARAQLTRWCREILVDGVQKLLPIEALLSGKEIPDLRDWIQDKQDDEDRPTLSSFRGPVPRVKDLPVDDLETGRRRLGAFLNLQSGWVQV